MKTLHKIAYSFFYPIIVLLLKLKFGYSFEKATNLPDTYIVLSNHVTDWDPLFVASSFPRQMYFVASEHIARWKIAYTFLKTLFAPIMRYKGTVASSTVKEVFRKVKDGSNVCIFAEGVRTWDGITCPILPSTGKMVKSCRCGLVTYKIVGGYFVSPMWSESNLRKGYIHGAPVNVYTTEQLASMSVDEINEAIRRDLYEDAYERQMANPQKYKGKDLAKHMENLLFICPECGEIDSISTENDTVTCTKCNLKFKYNEYGMLEGLPFKTVRELAAWQRDAVAKATAQNIVFTSENGILTTVKNHKETLVSQGKISLSSEMLRCGEKEIPLSEINDMAMHGRHALVFSTSDSYYEMIPSDSNSLKFQWLYECYKKNTKEKER